MRTWIGFDLDGTLAKEIPNNMDDTAIGEPIESMVKLARAEIARGKDVRIFTARAHCMTQATRFAIEDWCREVLGKVLPIQSYKDSELLYFYDDRAKGVEYNLGKLIGEE